MEINVINYMLLHFMSTEVFEIWVLVLCPRGVSPSLITTLPSDGQCSTWWLTDWVTDACTMLYSAWLYYVRFDIVRLQAARYPLVRAAWYRRYSRYLCRFTIFFTATIYRGISWLWRYWYRHVSIDDKYRGIAGIAQHYCWVLKRFRAVQYIIRPIWGLQIIICHFPRLAISAFSATKTTVSEFVMAKWNWNTTVGRRRLTPNESSRSRDVFSLSM